MSKSEGSVTINASIEKVFDAIADPEKIARTSSGILAGANGKPDEPGSYAEWVYPVAGMKIHARTTVSEVNKPNRLVQAMSGTMPGTWTWNIEQADQAVKVDFSIDYRVPGGILGKTADRLFLGRMNQRNLENTLYKLKAFCET